MLLREFDRKLVNDELLAKFFDDYISQNSKRKVIERKG